MSFEPTGQQLMDFGIAQVEKSHANWMPVARVLAVTVAKTRGTVTADDLRAGVRLGLLWEPDHPNAWGAVFKGAPPNIPGRFVAKGYTKSTTVTRHAGMIRIWGWEACPDTQENLPA